LKLEEGNLIFVALACPHPQHRVVFGHLGVEKNWLLRVEVDLLEEAVSTAPQVLFLGEE